MSARNFQNMQTQKNTEKRWVIKNPNTEDSRRLVREMVSHLSIHPVIAQLLLNRGCKTPDEARAFITLEKEMLCDPFLLADIRPAVKRILAAIKSNERIVVYGDYDVDGVTAVCTLYLYLREKGANVHYHIPNRTGEGYGVSCAAVQRIAEEGTALIITVDNGITAAEEVCYAKDLGVDFVVTDHHECRSELPDAVAVVNPHRFDCPYPFKDLAGVGVVFKLICALEETLTGDARLSCVERLCNAYADLVAIGTIADVMPIVGENKLIVRYGLEMIADTKRLGLRALMEAAATGKDGKKGKPVTKITSSYIGYTLAPRINAAGRIRSASRAVELFLSEKEEDAALIARELCDVNRERQEEENLIMQEAYAKIEEGYDFEKDPVIVLDADTWHHGVIGIVASRITEKYGLPSILISFEGNDTDGEGNDIGKGSGRSVKGMNLVDALVHCQDYLVKFGGHELAAGLSVTRENLPAFKKAICAYAREKLASEDTVPTAEADCGIRMSDATMELAEDLSLLEPYGTGNPVPVFEIRDLTVLEMSPVGAGKHTRFLFGDGKTQISAIFFGRNSLSLNLFVGDRVDILANLDINEWNGRRTLQLNVRDVHLSDSVFIEEKEQREHFDRIWAGEAIDASEGLVPTREEFAAVYSLVRRSVRNGCDSLSHRALLARLAAEPTLSIGYIKLKFIIRVFQELNLLGIEETSDEQYTFRIQFPERKTELDKSNILRKLRAQQKSV